MATKSPEIEILIRTQADTTGVDKASASLTKLETVGDELDEQTKKTKAAFDALEASIKSAGAASDVAGDQMVAGAQKGAQASNTLGKLGGVIDVAQAGSDAAQAGFTIGKEFGDAFARVIDNDWDWKKFFGGAVIQDGAIERKKELRELQLQAIELREELEKDPQGGLLQYMQDLGAAVAQVTKELAAQKEIQGAENKAEDSRDADAMADKKRGIEQDDGLSKEEKIRKLADLEDQADMEAAEKKERRRLQDLENQDAELSTAISARDKAEEAAAKARSRVELAAKIEGNEEYQRAAASGVSDRQLDAIRGKLGEREGVADIGSVKDEQGTAGKLESEAEKARTKAADEARETQTLIKKQDIERGEDNRQLGRRRDQRGEQTERNVNEAGAGDVQAEMADAAKEAKNATKATEEGGDNLADGLKEMADMVKGKNKAMAAALEKMAADLEDGASPEELDRIQAAMKVAAQSQNKAFSDLGKAMDQQASNIEEAARMAAEALKKTKALEAKIRSMRTGA